MAIGTVNVAGAQPKALEQMSTTVSNLSTNLQNALNKMGTVPEGSTLASMIGTVSTDLGNHKNATNPHGISPSGIGAAEETHNHTKSQITDFPTTMAPSAHNQAASTITAGTFAGQVVAKSDAQAPGTACLRNSSVSLTESTPSVNGQINWLAE